MKSKNLPYSDPGLVFPVAEEYLQKISEKLPGPVTMICDPAWIDALKHYESKYHVTMMEWDGNEEDVLAPRLEGSRSIILSYPEGEDRLINKLAPLVAKVNPQATCYRFLRDIFIHVSLQLGGMFMPQKEWKTFGPGNPAYFIFAIPRTGSTFFSDILHKTKLLGFPREHLLINLLPVFRSTDLDLLEWIQALVKYTCTSNGYAGTKIISHLFLEILDYYEDREGLKDELAGFISRYPVMYLKRRNKVRQAISLVIAQKSSIWHIKQGKVISSNRQNQAISETHAEIDRAMKYLQSQEIKLEMFFEKAGIIPRVYYYEDFSDEQKKEDIFREVIASLNVDYQGLLPETSYEALSDHQNDSFVREYYRNLQERLDHSDYPEGMLAQCILSSMSAELASINLKDEGGGASGKTGKRKRWRFF